MQGKGLHFGKDLQLVRSSNMNVCYGLWINLDFVTLSKMLLITISGTNCITYLTHIMWIKNHQKLLHYVQLDHLTFLDDTNWWHTWQYNLTQLDDTTIHKLITQIDDTTWQNFMTQLDTTWNNLTKQLDRTWLHNLTQLNTFCWHNLMIQLTWHNLTTQLDTIWRRNLKTQLEDTTWHNLMIQLDTT